MPASLVASFLVFVMTGVYAFWIVGSGVTGSNLADFLIYATLMANAVYFYYFEAYAEIDETEHARLVRKPILEWYLRLANHAILISLWLALEQNFIWFLALWILFYILMISWDFLTYERLSSPSEGNLAGPSDRPTLPKWDLIGLFLTLVFLGDLLALRTIINDGPLEIGLPEIGLTYPVNLDTYSLIFVLGVICVCYIWLINLASAGLKFRLRDHFRRPNLR